jgi:hypothetical protein
MNDITWNTPRAISNELLHVNDDQNPLTFSRFCMGLKRPFTPKTDDLHLLVLIGVSKDHSPSCRTVPSGLVSFPRPWACPMCHDPT